MRLAEPDIFSNPRNLILGHPWDAICPFETDISLSPEYFIIWNLHEDLRWKLKYVLFLSATTGRNLKKPKNLHMHHEFVVKMLEPAYSPGLSIKIDQEVETLRLLCSVHLVDIPGVLI